MSDLIGSGLSFPLAPDQRGVLALAHGINDIEQAIKVILGTAPGERPMRPEFGCAVHDLVFDTIDAEMVGRVDSAVHQALARWEPRIEVDGARVRPQPGRRGGAAHHHHLPGAADQPPLQPRLPVLRDPRRGDSVSEPRRPPRRARPRRDHRRGSLAGGGALPGAHRQRRPGPGGRAHRAVRVDEQPGHRPPRAGSRQAADRAAGPAGDRARGAGRGAHGPAHSGSAPRPPSR